MDATTYCTRIRKFALDAYAVMALGLAFGIPALLRRTRGHPEPPLVVSRGFWGPR